MHVGGVRTALFAWLVARQANGTFILRIEDTDKDREVAGSEEHIITTLKSLGLDYDEGPGKESSYGPYRQSERLDLYHKWAKKLIELNRAYADPYSVSELENFRTKAREDKKAFLFRDYRPDNPPEWNGSQPLRFRSEPKSYSWHDEIMGDLRAGPEAVDDFILIKSDGYPTYNFAHIVDDQLMAISHVIRAQEFLASVPRFLNLYEALGIERPLLATVPHVLGPDGNKKLSKRDGAKDVLEYIKEGYLPEALLNFMASLGWNDGTEQEIFNTNELIAKFRLDQVQKSGARFDDKRLNWMNGAHIRGLNLDELFERSRSFLPPPSKNFPEDYQKKVISIIQDRLKYLAEIKDLTSFFFETPKVNLEFIKNDRKLADIANDQLVDWLTRAKTSLEESDFSLSDISDRLNGLLTETNQKPAVLFSLIRIAVSQSQSSPGLFETIEVLGKEQVINRLERQIAALR